MKNVVKVLAIAAASVAFSFNANAAPTMDSYVENALVKVCKTATRPSALRFAHTLKRYNLRTRTVAQRVVCNGQAITDFAISHGADKVATRLQRSMGSNGSVTIRDIAKAKQAEKIYVTL